MRCFSLLFTYAPLYFQKIKKHYGNKSPEFVSATRVLNIAVPAVRASIATSHSLVSLGCSPLLSPACVFGLFSAVVTRLCLWVVLRCCHTLCVFGLFSAFVTRCFRGLQILSEWRTVLGGKLQEMVYLKKTGTRGVEPGAHETAVRRKLLATKLSASGPKPGQSPRRVPSCSPCPVV